MIIREPRKLGPLVADDLRVSFSFLDSKSGKRHVHVLNFKVAQSESFRLSMKRAGKLMRSNNGEVLGFTNNDWFFNLNALVRYKDGLGSSRPRRLSPSRTRRRNGKRPIASNRRRR